MYTASNHLHATTNEGESWELLSPDLTRNDPSKLKSSGGPITQDNTSVEYYCTIFAAAESPVKEGVIWTGSDDGLINITKDGGANWEDVTPKGMPEWMMINSIEPSVFDAGTCYVAGTKYKTGDFAPYLYKTNDFGKSWEKITNGIPSEHFTRVLREDPKQKGILYAGTETGMYISFDDGSNWKTFQLNLPIVPITDLAVKDNNLIVVTQGRSLWIIDDLSLLHQLSEAKNKENFIYKPKDAYRMGGRSNSKSLTTGTNHPSGVMTYFNVENPDEKEVKISYLNKQGDTIKSFTTKGSKEKNNKVDKAHKSIKKIRKINSQLEAFQKQYKEDDGIKGLVEKAKMLSESFSEIEKTLYQTKNKSGQDPLNFPIRLTNKLAHLNSLVGMDDFPPTQQDVAVKNELSGQINAQLTKFDQLISEEIAAFNAAFNQKKLNYLFVEEDK